MSKRAEEAALRAYDTNVPASIRIAYRDGYEAAEKDMKKRFIQFVHSHYPINYTGWIQDFQRAMEDEK